MPHPSTHLHPTTALHTKPDPAWADWDRAWTRHIKTLTGRDDLTVTVAPGAGGGAPACFYPDTGRIEIDATHIGTPTTANPRRAGHKKLVPTAYGLLVHEAAHARSSRWQIPPGTPPVVADVALLLEESRAEGRQRTARRGDRRWLRQTVTTLITPDDTPIDDPWHAAHLAGLLLARVDARIITNKDTKAIRAAVTTILGKKRLTRLRDIWRQAHTTSDTDATTMIELAWQWCRTLDINPSLHPNTPIAPAGEFTGRLARAVEGYLAHAAGLTPGEYRARRITERHRTPAEWTLRDPTPQEQAAARQLAIRLRQARTHTLEPDNRPAPVPPGRLRTRQAITAQAQIAAGQIPTATPWQRRSTTPPHKPRLHLAVLVDVSGSMHAYAEPMSSAAWILAHGARHTDATTTTIAFGETVTLLVPPQHRPTHIQQMRANDGHEEFTDAVKLADQLLNLRQHNTIRMLTVVSDGQFTDTDAAQRLITTLHHSGCAVLWLRPPHEYAHTYTDTTTITLTDPVEAIIVIADAATIALRDA